MKTVSMKMVVLLALVFVFAFSGVSMAKKRGLEGRAPGPGKGDIMPPGKWWKSPQVADKLRLTQEEKEKLDTMFLEHRHQMIDLDANVAKERLELEYLLDSSNFDSAACMERFKKLQEAHVNAATERFKFLVQVRQLLGLERFQQLKAEFQKHRKKKRQSGRRPSRPGAPVG